MDGAKLFEAFLGSFLGFGFALLAEFIIKQVAKHFDINKTKSNLKNELGHIFNAYYDEEAQAVTTGKVFLETPIWDTVINTGVMLVMLKRDEAYYNEILSIYCLHKEIEKMEAEDNEDYYEYIQDNKEQIVESISSIIFSN